MSDHLYQVKFTRNNQTSVITKTVHAESASQAKEKIKSQEKCAGKFLSISNVIGVQMIQCEWMAQR